jgi:CO/xanthine dehydrogenase Mo-binding subunit
MGNPPPSEGAQPSNVAYHLIINKGDIEAGFKEADVILENTYCTKKVHQGYIEPFAAVATASADGKVTVWTQSQGIFMAQQMLARFLDLPLERINVVPLEIGGAFGGKTYLPVAPFCALLAMKTGRPVRMELTREEVLKDSRPAPESVITVKMGATRQGDITAAEISLIYDAGAYPEMSHAMFVSQNLLCQYRLPNVKIDAKDMLTNKVPSAFYRAPAMPQAHFATESHLDLIARALGIDPLQIRLRNAAQEGDTMPSGEILPRVGFKETLEKMAAHLGEKRAPEGLNQGRGIACGFWHGAAGSFGAHVRVNGDGTVNLIMGVTDVSGSRTSVAQIVAEELHLPLDKVIVICGDTDTAPWATMSVGSLTVYSLSTAVYRACQDVKTKLCALAADKLEASVSDIEFNQGCFRVKGKHDKTLSFADIARSTTSMMGGTGPVVGWGSVASLSPAPTLSVHAADVEIDRETGKAKILSYSVAQDVGRAINPMSIEGQIQGAVAQGIGWALTESYIFDQGILQNSTLLDYRMPTANDVPMIDTLLVEVNSAEGVYGLRHVGEPPIIASLAAIANAVHSATGVRLKELPMTPEAILSSLKTQDKPKVK